MSNVINLFPCNDIPVMLRRLADAIEEGTEPPFETVLCVGLESDLTLSGFMWGEEKMTRLAAIGAVTVMRDLLVQDVASGLEP